MRLNWIHKYLCVSVFFLSINNSKFIFQRITNNECIKKS